MPKFKVMATSYTFFDAIVEAKDEHEAFELAEADEVEWYKPSVTAGDWQVHGDMIIEITEEENNG